MAMTRMSNIIPYIIFLAFFKLLTKPKHIFNAFYLITVLNNVATKIENWPKTNTKILWFLKMDWRQIQRFFVISKNLWRFLILQRPSKIQRFSKENGNVLLLQIVIKLNYKILINFGIFRFFQTILSKILINFPKKSLQSLPKIFKASKILWHLEMNWRSRWRRIFGKNLQRSSNIHCNTGAYQCWNKDWKWTEDKYEDSLVTDNGLKTNTKILRFLKMDRSQIRIIFINLKFLQRSLKIANSLNIFEDTKWKIFIDKIAL